MKKRILNLLFFEAFFTFIFGVFVYLSNANESDTVLSKTNLKNMNAEMSSIAKKQLEVENNIVSKFPFYEQILKGYERANLISNQFLYSNFKQNFLIPISTEKNIYADQNFRVLIRKYPMENAEEEFRRRMELFDAIYRGLEGTNINFSVYAISGLYTSFAIFDFNTEITSPYQYGERFKQTFWGRIHHDYLKIAGFKTYQKYFFKTDHHLTIFGAYEVYKDLLELLNVKQRPLPKSFYKVMGVQFRGANARTAVINDIFDQFYDIEFELPFEIYLNGEKITYDEISKKNLYHNGVFSLDEYANHYAEYFHSDYAELEYIFQNDTNRNLLIIGDSYTNNMEHLIASHFDKTYVIDLRHYEEAFGEKFELREYIGKRGVTDVLFLMSANNIYFESGSIELY